MCDLTTDTGHRFLSIVSNHTGKRKNEIVADTPIDTLGIDSLAFVELIMAFEKEFNITLHDDDLEEVKTIQDVYSQIEMAIEAAA